MNQSPRSNLSITMTPSRKAPADGHEHHMWYRMPCLAHHLVAVTWTTVR